MSANDIDIKRRRVVTYTTTAVGAVGAAFLVVPFIKSWMPNERAKNAGAPVAVDISKLNSGELLRVEWQGKPVWILKRTEEMMKRLNAMDKNRLVDPESKSTSQQPEYAANQYRSRVSHPETVVIVGICTHLGCSPTFRPDIAPADLGKDWEGGFYCPCHGSKFDLAGRIFKNLPAPSNLVIPKYYYVNDNQIIIGLSGEGEA